MHFVFMYLHTFILKFFVSFYPILQNETELESVKEFDRANAKSTYKRTIT